MTNRVVTWVLGRDKPADLAIVLGAFVAYLLLDRWTGAIAVISQADLGSFSLTAAAAVNRWWLLVPLLALFAVGVKLRPKAMTAAWGDLDGGGALQVLATVMVVLLAWQATLYNVNFFADRVHGFDRALVAILAALAIYRPIGLIPFVVAVRVVNEQFLYPFGTVASKSVDELLLIALLAIAVSHLLLVVTGTSKTAPTLLIIGTAVASHFFWPGKAKLVSDWLQLTDVGNLPLSSYTAGWLGGTDGTVARAISDFFGFFRLPILVGTLVIEVGAILAVIHPKVLRLWLPSFAFFHIMTFATTGFFFIGWTLLELGLLLLLALPRFGAWVVANATPARGLISVAAVVGAPVLFHPPGLVWLDAPISYGYEIEAVGESGDAYHVPISALAPLDQHVSFTRLQLADRLAGSGGYGAISTKFELDRLNEINDFEALEIYETALGEAPSTGPSQDFFLAYFDHVNDGDHIGWFGLGPPDRFWTSREAPTYDFSEPLERLEVVLVTSIHGEGGLTSRRQVVLAIEDEEGTATVVSPVGR